MYLQFLISFVATVILIFIGYKLSIVIKEHKVKIILVVFFFILCLPAFSFLVMELPIFIKPIWFVEFRSISGIELLTSFWGLFIGFVTVKSDTKKVRWKMFNKYFYIIAVLLMVPPYIHCIGIPINYENLKSQFHEDVCLQSEEFTCAPASLATVFKYFDKEKTEAQIAKDIYTSRSGTSVYEIIRYIKKNEMKVECFYEKDLSNISVPSILDVNVYNIGHVIVYLGSEDGRYIIGDPLEGRIVLSKEEFYNRYEFNGFVMSIKTLGNFKK